MNAQRKTKLKSSQITQPLQAVATKAVAMATPGITFPFVLLDGQRPVATVMLLTHHK
jgi:hypothetical protein